MVDDPDIPHRKTRHLPWIVRTVIVATFGALVALLASYLLRKIGF